MRHSWTRTDVLYCLLTQTVHSLMVRENHRTRHWRLLDMLGNKKDRPDLFIIQSRRSFRCIYNLLILFLLIVSPCIHNQCQSDNSVGNEYTEVLTDRSVTKQVLSCGWSYDEK
mgnify:FL=1